MKRAILLVDHGSRRAEANGQLDALAGRIRQLRPEHFVATAHLEVLEPSIRQGIEVCVASGAGAITVVPYFLAPGRHSQEDIPREVDEARAAHPGVEFRIAQPLGLHERLIEALLDRSDQAS